MFNKYTKSEKFNANELLDQVLTQSGKLYSFIEDVNNGLSVTNFDKWSHKNSYESRIYKNENIYTIEMSLPAFSKEDLNISITEDNNLSVSYTAAPLIKGAENLSFWKTSFDKTFYISSDLDLEKIKASMTNGLLKIEIPLKGKATTSAKSVTIH